MVTVFMPTQMIYSTTLRQINYLASWMLEYIEKADMNNEFEKRLALSMKDLLNNLYSILNIFRYRPFLLLAVSSIVL